MRGRHVAPWRAKSAIPLGEHQWRGHTRPKPGRNPNHIARPYDTTRRFDHLVGNVPYHGPPDHQVGRGDPRSRSAQRRRSNLAGAHRAFVTRRCERPCACHSCARPPPLGSPRGRRPWAPRSASAVRPGLWQLGPAAQARHLLPCAPPESPTIHTTVALELGGRVSIGAEDAAGAPQRRVTTQPEDHVRHAPHATFNVAEVLSSGPACPPRNSSWMHQNSWRGSHLIEQPAAAPWVLDCNQAAGTWAYLLLSLAQPRPQDKLIPIWPSIESIRTFSFVTA